MLTSRVPYPLVLELEKLYPPKSIGPKQSEIDAHRYAAKVELVEFLRHNFNQQSPDVPVEAPKHVDPETGVRTYDEQYGGLSEE